MITLRWVSHKYTITYLQFDQQGDIVNPHHKYNAYIYIGPPACESPEFRFTGRQGYSKVKHTFMRFADIYLNQFFTLNSDMSFSRGVI